MGEQTKTTTFSIEDIEVFLIAILLIALPITLLTSFANAYVTPKVVFLAGVVILLTIIKSVKSLVRGSVKMHVTNFDFPLLLMGVAYVASTFINKVNRIEAFFLPGTTTVIVSAVILYLSLSQISKKRRESVVEASLMVSAALLALVSLMEVAGIFRSMNGPAFMQTAGFSPIGGSLSAFIYFVSILPLGIAKVMRERSVGVKSFFGGMSVIIAIGVFVAGLNILPGRSTTPQLPGYTQSWNVLVDSLKNRPLLGVGPANYVAAFSQFRTIAYNQTDLWRIRFSDAQSFYLTVSTEVGLVGIAALILLFVTVARSFKKSEDHRQSKGPIVSVGIILVALALFPASIPLIVLFVTLLSLIAKTNEVNLGIMGAGNSLSAKLPVIVATLPIVAIAVAAAFFGVKIVSAEHTYKRSLDAVSQNEAKQAYDLMRDAIIANPYADRYRMSYAQLNLALSNAIAQNKDITDEDRTTVAQLVQQAIREAKAGVSLNPGRSTNWEVLARVYQAIIPLAKDADVYAVQSYRQAIALDPLNTDLRISLGGLIYARKDYESAARAFELAVSTKPDYANAHYNLAYAYRDKGNIEGAIQQMTAVLSLVDKNSKDYETAKKVLEELEAKKKTDGASGENLTAPGTTQDVLDPKLDLPEGSEPPAPEVSPTPAPTATPKASPNASPSATPTIEP